MANEIREKARAYYEGDPDLYATSGWLDHNDIQKIVEEAFVAGAEGKGLTWKDVQKIVNIADNIVRNYQDGHSVLFDEKAYYTDVLRRFKLASRNSDKDLQGYDASYLQSKIDAHTEYMQEHGITSEQQLATLEEMRGNRSEIPVNPWHKVSEELPKMTHFTTGGDYSDLCVCINESGEHKILVLCEDSDYTYWAYGYDGEGLYDEEIDGEITHWMYIPELPKEE